VLLREQRIHELEQQRRLEASESVIEGAEQERKRIARDLHDGLGGLLTGLRLNLGAVRGNYITTTSAAAEFDKAVDLLDESIGELRRVARNMMPETLLRLGLRDALDDFCSVMGRDKPYRVVFSSYGELFRVPARYETGIYRMAMELINNAVRHSGANVITAQLIYDNGRVHLTVSDDGKGFDTGAPVAGTGLAGLRSRCKSLGGTLVIESSPGSGTEVSAEFNTGKADEKSGDS
jgi:signal transduction histidine kinase